MGKEVGRDGEKNASVLLCLVCSSVFLASCGWCELLSLTENSKKWKTTARTAEVNFKLLLYASVLCLFSTHHACPTAVFLLFDSVFISSSAQLKYKSRASWVFVEWLHWKEVMESYSNPACTSGKLGKTSVFSMHL